MWAKVEIGYSTSEPIQQTAVEVQRNMQKVLRSAFYWILVGSGKLRRRRIQVEIYP